MKRTGLYPKCVGCGQQGVGVENTVLSSIQVPSVVPLSG